MWNSISIHIKITYFIILLLGKCFTIETHITFSGNKKIYYPQENQSAMYDYMLIQTYPIKHRNFALFHSEFVVKPWQVKWLQHSDTPIYLFTFLLIFITLLSLRYQSHIYFRLMPVKTNNLVRNSIYRLFFVTVKFCSLSKWRKKNNQKMGKNNQLVNFLKFPKKFCILLVAL